MNLEMLLETNNIRFDSKLGNIRQMVSKLFNSNEEPIVDNFSLDGVEINNINIPNFHIHGEKTDGSWIDVKNIFETFNTQTITHQTSSQNQQQKLSDERRNQQSLRKLLKDQSNKLDHRKDFDEARMEDHTSETVYDTECGEMNANKENMRDSIDPRASAGLTSKSQLQNSIYSIQESKVKAEPIHLLNENIFSSVQSGSSTRISPSRDNSKHAPSLLDQSNRIRQVNVEMFTVSLKRSD